MALAASAPVGCKNEPGATTAPAARAGAALPSDEEEAHPRAPAFARITLTTSGMVFDALAAGPEDGELVLLLHGFPESSFEWREVMPLLAAHGYRVVAPDQRGYSPGARPAATADYALRNMVGDTLGMVTALGRERFHVVGHDWGAAVAWALASNLPRRVLSMTAVSTAHPDALTAARAEPGSCQARASSVFAARMQPTAAAALLADDAAPLRAELSGLPTEAVDVYLGVLGTEPALDAALRWYRANLDPTVPRPQLGPVTVPTLYLLGDRDPSNCVDTERGHASLMKGPYRFEIFPGVDHWLPERAPEQVAQHISAHLRAAGEPR